MQRKTTNNDLHILLAKRILVPQKVEHLVDFLFIVVCNNDEEEQKKVACTSGH